MPVEHAQALLESIRRQLATSHAPVAIDNPFAYRRRDDGYAMEENGTPILWTDAAGRELRFLVPAAVLRVDLGQYVRAMTPKLLQLRGATVVHASACALAEGLIAFAGESGAGKTTTARALADAGGELISEDLLVFARDGADGAIFEDGERRAYAWSVLTTERLTRAPAVPIPCYELDAVSAGARRTLRSLWFIDRRRRAGEEIIKERLTPIDGVVTLLGNNFLGGGDAASCRRHVSDTHRIASVIDLWRATMPSGLDALAAAARRYAANSAS
jgi:hypothetical protein